MSPDKLLQFDNVSFRQEKRTILETVNFSLFPREIVSIIGPNGAGKTTLVKLAAGLLKPTTGRVIPRRALRIGYVPQRMAIDATFPLTVERFLVLGHEKGDIPATLQEVGVAPLQQARLSDLSGGELQRVLLARAMLRHPDLLILDEPTQGVDLGGQSELYALIARIRDKQGCGVLLVSHDLTMVMAQTDTVICLNRHICCSGHPSKISQDPAFIALFEQASHHFAFYAHHHDHAHGAITHSEEEKRHE